MAQAEYDPVLTEGEPSEGPSDDSTEGGGFVFGEELPDSPQQGPEADDAGQSDEAGNRESPGTESTTDDAAQPGETEEEQRLRWQDYSRKTMDLAEQRRQWEAEREREREELREQREQLNQALQQIRNPQQQSASTLDQLQQLANSPDLSQVDRAGLNFIAQQQQTIEELRGELQEFKQWRDGVEPKVEQATTATQQMTEREQQERLQALKQEASEAERLFSKGIVQQHADFLQRNLGAMHPTENRPYTIAELIAKDKGVDIQEARQAKQGNRQARRTAKSQASPVGRTPSSADQGGYLTESEALEAMRQVRE